MGVVPLVFPRACAPCKHRRRAVRTASEGFYDAPDRSEKAPSFAGRDWPQFRVAESRWRRNLVISSEIGRQRLSAIRNSNASWAKALMLLSAACAAKDSRSCSTGGMRRLNLPE